MKKKAMAMNSNSSHAESGKKNFPDDRWHYQQWDRGGKKSCGTSAGDSKDLPRTNHTYLINLYQSCEDVHLYPFASCFMNRFSMLMNRCSSANAS